MKPLLKSKVNRLCYQFQIQSANILHWNESKYCWTSFVVLKMLFALLYVWVFEFFHWNQCGTCCVFQYIYTRAIFTV